MGCGGSKNGGGCCLLNGLLLPAPESASYGEWSFKGEIIWVSLSQYCPQDAAADPADDYTFPCRLIQQTSPAKYLIIYFHRNADDIGSCRWFCEKLHSALGAHVLVVEYPGYGLCTASTPSGTQVTKHAVAALNFARQVLQWPMDSIIALGACIGCGPAIGLAAQEEIAGLVLVAPFLSVRKMLQNKVGPLAGFVGEQFPNDILAPRIKASTLVIHGEADKMFPIKHAEELIDKMTNCKSKLIKLQGVSHHTCLTKDEQHMLKPMIEFYGMPGVATIQLSLPEWALNRQQQHPYPTPGPPVSAESGPIPVAPPAGAADTSETQPE